MLDSEKGNWRKSAGHAHFWLQFIPPSVVDREEHHDSFQLCSQYYTTDIIRICSTLKFILIAVLCWRPTVLRCTYVCVRTHAEWFMETVVFHDSNHYQVFKCCRVTARLVLTQQQNKSSPSLQCKSIWLCNCTTADLMTLPFPTRPPSPCALCLSGYISFHFHAHYVPVS